MTCSEYQELISAYIDDELSQKEIIKLLKHLDKCSNCKKELSSFILQKENLISIRSAYLGPIPDHDFSQKILQAINNEESLKKVKKYRLNWPEFLPWLIFPAKKPILGVLFSILIFIIGIFSGTLLGIFPSQKEQKKLLSVYELKANQVSEENIKIASIEEKNDESIIFHHVAHSSVETFATDPCLLEYAAYTSTSNN